MLHTSLFFLPHLIKNNVDDIRGKEHHLIRRDRERKSRVVLTCLCVELTDNN